MSIEISYFNHLLIYSLIVLDEAVDGEKTGMKAPDDEKTCMKAPDEKLAFLNAELR